MILLDMIKKYEGIKEDLEKQSDTLSTEDSIEITGHILRDLRSVLKDTSGITIYNTLLEKISKSLERNNFDDAFKLVQMVQMLSQ